MDEDDDDDDDDDGDGDEDVLFSQEDDWYGNDNRNYHSHSCYID